MLLLMVISMSSFLPTDSGIPDLEELFLSNQWQEMKPYLSPDQMVRINLKPILNDRGRMSSSQVLYSLRKLFSRYILIEVKQGDFRSDTNYSQVEITVQFKIKHRKKKHTAAGTFLFLFNFRHGRPVLTRWTVTDFSP